MALQLRRGTDAERQAMTPAEGELIYVVDYDSVGTSPLWIGDGATAGGLNALAPLNIAANTATNLAGGDVGSIPYQTASSSTSFIPIGAVGSILASDGTTATWQTLASLSSGAGVNADNVFVNTPTAGDRYIVLADDNGAYIAVEADKGATAPVYNIQSGLKVRSTLTIGGNIIPDTDGIYNIGGPSARFATLYLTTSTIDLGGETLTAFDNVLYLNNIEIISTSTIGNYQSSTATNLAGGTAGQIAYQTAPGITSFAGPGTAGQLLVSAGTSSPVYTNTGSIYVGNAAIADSVNSANTSSQQVGYSANLLAGSAGSIPYQSGANATTYLSIGTNGFVLSSNGSAPIWTALSGLSAGQATTATNLADGTAGQIPYQSSPGNTGFIGPGTAGQILVSAGASAPTYTNTGSIYVGNAAVADSVNSANTSTQQVGFAATAGSLLAANTGSTYVGFANKSNNVVGGTAGQLVYQSGVDTTAFAGPGTAGQILVSAGASAPSYTNTGSIYVGNAATANVLNAGNTSTQQVGYAANVLAGAAGSILYQTAANATGMLGISSTDGAILVSNGSNAPQYATWTTAFTTGTGSTAVATNQSLRVTGGGIGVVGDSFFKNNVGIDGTLNVTGAVTFSSPVTFNGTATYVLSTNTLYTDNILELHVHPGGVNTQWQVDDGKDIGFRFHYYTASTDTNAALVLANDTKFLEWYSSGAEGTSTFAGSSYGTFKTGNLILTDTAGTTNATSGAIQVAGGVGVGGNLYVAGVITATTFVGAMSGTATSANNISGGTAGQLVYQTGVGATGFAGPGTAGQILVSAGASAPTYTNTGSIYVGNAATANALNSGNTATQQVGYSANLLGGTAGQLSYQSAANTTAFMGPGSYGQFLMSAGAAVPVYQSTLTLSGSNILITSNTSATSTSTGALQVVNGGAGIGGDVYVGGSLFTNRFLASSYRPVAPSDSVYQGNGSVSTQTTVSLSTVIHLQVHPNGRFVYGVAYTAGIGVYSINTTTGALTLLQTAAPGLNQFSIRGVAVNPSGNCLVVTNYGSSSITPYTINQSTGILTTGTTVAAGSSPRDLTIDPSGRFVYVANQSDNTISQYTINATSGVLTTITNAISCGTGPYNVSVDATGRFAYAINYLSNNITQYTINQSTGALTSTTNFSPGFGPQYSVADPSGRFLYVCGGNRVASYSINQSTGVLTQISVNIMSSTSLEYLTTDPNGRYVYASNAATSGFLEVLSVNPVNGALTPVSRTYIANTMYKGSIEPTGRFLYVGQTNNIYTLAINNFSAGQAVISAAVDATNTQSGALQVVGGLGVGAAGFFGGNVTAPAFIGAVTGTATTATNVAGGTAGQIVYQTAAGATSFAGPGTAGQILVSAGTSAPTYTNTGSIYVGNAATANVLNAGNTATQQVGYAANVLAGAAGSLHYQTGANATGMLAIGAAGTYLTSSGTAPQWSTTSTGQIGYAANLLAGAAGSLPYQSGANATTQLSIGAANTILVSTGSAPSWVSTSSIYATKAANADKVDTVIATGNAVHYVTFVDSNNVTAATEINYTTSTFVVNPATGNVAIGTTSTTNKFQISGAYGQLFSVVDSFTGTVFAASDISGIPSIEVLDTGFVKIAQYGGTVAISTASTVTSSGSTMGLTVWTSTYLLSLGVGSTASGVVGEIRASNEITAYYSSDRRLKENVRLITDPITLVNQLNGVYFDWTDEHIERRGGEDGFFVRKDDVGVIAQEVEAVLPQLVADRPDGFKGVKYEKMIPLLIEAIKQQDKTINRLEEELREIKTRLSNLE